MIQREMTVKKFQMMLTVKLNLKVVMAMRLSLITVKLLLMLYLEFPPIVKVR